MYICSIVSIYYDDYEADLFSRLSLFLYSSVIIIIRKLRFGVKEESNILTSKLHIAIENELTENYFGQN